jgi:hypothetical protein
VWVRQCRRLGEDDGAMGPGKAWVIGVASSRTTQGAQHRGLGEDDVVAGSGMASRVWGQGLRGERHHRLGSGNMAACKGLDCGWE